MSEFRRERFPVIYLVNESIMIKAGNMSLPKIQNLNDWIRKFSSFIFLYTVYGCVQDMHDLYKSKDIIKTWQMNKWNSKCQDEFIKRSVPTYIANDF